MRVGLRQPAGFLATSEPSQHRRPSWPRPIAGAWRWRSSHQDIAGRLEAVDDALGHDRGQELGRLHPGHATVTGQRESVRRDEVFASGRD
jgi:hypothetical protein